MSTDAHKGKDFDPYLEAVKIEWVMYLCLMAAKDFLQAGRLPYLMLQVGSSSGKNTDDEASLVSQANGGAISAFKDAAKMVNPLKMIVAGHPESFTFRDKEDYANIGQGFETVAGALGEKKGWRFWRKIVPDEQLVELGTWLILKTIESGFVYADKIPMERREAFIRTFLGLQAGKMPVSCSLRLAAT
ncbi:MAG TPA: hypothetical protein P5080_02495 [Candidatus Paceibacterota bacterium]|nr:hypothetical protein [Candidatus Pacearchaeota archaeon]HRZ50838.1 hypothetical protein [Candidatus Paceibacterota bacterium]HSA36559.1 hypothetical protein [Candidatus Paceibacterota bacterium]